METQHERLMINGIDGATGEALLPPLSPEQLAQHLYYERLERTTRHFTDLERKNSSQFKYRCSCDTINPEDLATSGWGVIFATELDYGIRRALAPLLEHRRQQATAIHNNYYNEYRGDDGYCPGETADDFLRRLAITGVPPQPGGGMPYYLLLVGDTNVIPTSFEQQLSLNYAVGRIACSSLEEYRIYAQSVVQAEMGNVPLAHEAACFSPLHPDDMLTTQTSHMLMQPLANHLASHYPTWHMHQQIAAAATRANFAALMGKDYRTDLLIAATHSVAFPAGHAEQLAYQGALLCQEWTGPEQWIGPLTPDMFFAGNALDPEADIHGMIALLLGSFSVATPAQERFPLDQLVGYTQLSPAPFMAALPRHMLTHPKGGALAVVGHSERAWSYGLPSANTRPYLDALTQATTHLMQSKPVGAALEPVRECYATYALALTNELEKMSMGKQPNALELVAMWAMMSDCRSLAVVGDPAVRLPIPSAKPQDQTYQASRPEQPYATPPISFTGRNVVGSAKTETETKPAPERAPEPTPSAPAAVSLFDDAPPPAYGDIPAVLGPETEAVPKTEVEKPRELPSLEPAPETRVINAWIDNLPENIPLQVGIPYELKFRVDEPRQDAKAHSESIGSLIEKMPTDDQFVQIRVVLETEDFTIYGDKQATIVVPCSGESKNTTTFTIEAFQPGEGTINALFTVNGRLFQEMIITLQTTQNELVESYGETVSAIKTRTRGMALDSAIILPVQKRLNDVNLSFIKRDYSYQLVLINGGVHRAYINVEKEVVEELVRHAREKFNEITYTKWHGKNIYLDQDTNIPIDVHLSSLKKLATLGNFLYQRLFYNNRSGADARGIGEFLRELSKERSLNIEIVTGNFVFPWNLIYDKNPNDDIDPEGFWGFKHIIEYMPEFSSPRLIQFMPEICVETDIILGFVYNENLNQRIGNNVVDEQKAALKTLTKNDLLEYARREDLFALLNNPDTPEHILYFYCDAKSYLPHENGGIDSSKLILTDGDVELKDLYAHSPTDQPPLNNAPLVFLNACKSASMSPYIYHGLVPYLLNRGVRGVIGTEIDTPAFFAAEFAQEFLKRFVAGGKQLGELLLEMRREYLFNNHNIMGLLYALHSSAEIVVQRET